MLLSYRPLHRPVLFPVISSPSIHSVDHTKKKSMADDVPIGVLPYIYSIQIRLLCSTDYQRGENGFERAPGWSSEIGRSMQ